MNTCCGRGFATDEAFGAHGTSVHPGCIAVPLRGETVEKAARNVMWDLSDQIVKARRAGDFATLVAELAAVSQEPGVSVGTKSVYADPAVDQDPALLPYKCPYCGRRFEEQLAETLHEDLVHSNAIREGASGAGEKETKNSGDASSLEGKVATIEWAGADADNADKPESFGDIQAAVQEAIGDLFMDPISERCPYVWIADISPDWVVFEVRSDYYKITYSMDENGKVTLAGPPVSVQRRTIYVPSPDDDDDDVPATA